MEKKSSTYNNKRFAQTTYRSQNYQDYERSPNIPEPAPRLTNTLDWLALDINKVLPFAKLYPDSIKNAKAFKYRSIFKGNPQFKQEISKFISYMVMLNDDKYTEGWDESKYNWLGKNTQPLDQYNEFTNWSQSERQKYAQRFETMKNNSRGVLLQKALIALKNAEIAAAKVSFPNNVGVQGAKYMSERTSPESTPNSTSKPSTSEPSSKPSSGSQSTGRERKTETPTKPKPIKFNYNYIKSIKDIDSANALAYHGAKRALGLKESDIDKYYTNENASKIKDEIIKIADSPYMNKLNPSLRGLKEKALDIVTSKIIANTKTEPAPSSNEDAGAGKAGPMETTTSPDGEQKVTSPVQTEAGDEIRKLLETAEGLDDNQLKRLWRNMLTNINLLLKNSQIDNLERVEFEQKIKDIGFRYYSAFHPEGGQQLASGSYVVNTPEALARILRSALKVNDTKTANDAVFKLKVLFDNDSMYVPYQELKTQLKSEIKRYNFGKDDIVDNF